MTEPSNAEVMRRLDEVARQLLALAHELRDDRRTAAETYVRKDVFTPVMSNVDGRVGVLEREANQKERDADAFRRQMIVGLVLLGLPAVSSLVIAVNVALTNGGLTP